MKALARLQEARRVQGYQEQTPNNISGIVEGPQSYLYSCVIMEFKSAYLLHVHYIVKTPINSTLLLVKSGKKVTYDTPGTFEEKVWKYFFFLSLKLFANGTSLFKIHQTISVTANPYEIARVITYVRVYKTLPSFTCSPSRIYHRE